MVKHRSNTIYCVTLFLNKKIKQDIGGKGMIRVYGKEDCAKCKTLKSILEGKQIPFEYIEDRKQLMMVASKARIMSAPVIEYQEKAYSMDDFLKVIS